MINMIKCVSVREPFAWAIIHGGKDVENRTWPTNHRGLLAIHASMQLHPYQAEGDIRFDAWTTKTKFDKKENLGKIVGLVTIIDCVPYDICESEWREEWPGAFCWILEKPMPIDPIPWTGRLGLFDVPAELFDLFRYGAIK